MAICEKCKREFDGEGGICPVCQEQSEKLEDRKLSPKRFILIFCDFALIAICLLVFLIPTFTDDSRNLSGSYDLASYVENGTLYCKNLDETKSEAVVLTEGIAQYADLSAALSYSQDGTVVYFPTNESEIDMSYTLCYYDFKTNGPVKEIAQNIRNHTVTGDGLKVFYTTMENYDLYQSDLTQSTKLAENIFSYEISTDGTKLVYTDYNDNVYLKNGEADAVLIGENADVEEITNNFGTVYFTDANEDKTSLTLKKADFEGNVTDIAENVYSEMKIYQSGEVYYCTTGDTDAPRAGNNYYLVPLYYYNGIENQLVSDRVLYDEIQIYALNFAENTANAVYPAISNDIEITKDSDPFELLDAAKMYHATGASEIIDLGSGDMHNIILSNNGTHVYFTATDEEYSDLYEIRLADGTEPKLIAKNATNYTVSTNNSVLYFTENGTAYDLYLGENKIGEGIYQATFSTDFASGVIATVNEKEQTVSVSAYINGEISTVAENATEYIADVENGLSVYYKTADGAFKYSADGTSVLISQNTAQLVF